jgi:hypothetical protein
LKQNGTIARAAPKSIFGPPFEKANAGGIIQDKARTNASCCSPRKAMEVQSSLTFFTPNLP